ncbi:MAG: response regulator transcription factor [Elusimicrobiaceae bacterium]
MEIKILLCDDHKIFREGLKIMLSANRRFCVAGEAADGVSAVSLAKKLAPHVVIMDISMPGLNGIEACRKIVAAHPGIKVIALSMHKDRRFVTGALRSGAKAYLLKESAFGELAEAIHSVLAGKVYLDPGVSSLVVEDYIGRLTAADESVFTVLSAREREVLQLIAEGLPTKRIAASLKLSVKTVETHRNKIMAKLHLNNIAALTKYAIKEGLTSL